jgi:hypothetical protein
VATWHLNWRTTQRGKASGRPKARSTACSSMEKAIAHTDSGAYLMCGSRGRLSAACGWRTGAPERHAATPNQEKRKMAGDTSARPAWRRQCFESAQQPPTAHATDREEQDVVGRAGLGPLHARRQGCGNSDRCPKPTRENQQGWQRVRGGARHTQRRRVGRAQATTPSITLEQERFEHGRGQLGSAGTCVHGASEGSLRVFLNRRKTKTWRVRRAQSHPVPKTASHAAGRQSRIHNTHM